MHPSIKYQDLPRLIAAQWNRDFFRELRFMASLSAMKFRELCVFIFLMRNDPDGPGRIASHGDALLHYSRHVPWLYELQTQKPGAIRHKHAAIIYKLLHG